MRRWACSQPFTKKLSSILHKSYIFKIGYGVVRRETEPDTNLPRAVKPRRISAIAWACASIRDLGKHRYASFMLPRILGIRRCGIESNSATAILVYEVHPSKQNFPRLPPVGQIHLFDQFRDEWIQVEISEHARTAVPGYRRVHEAWTEVQRSVMPTL